MLEKLTRGVLHVADADGLRFVRLELMERARLIWLFRNFSILPLRVLLPHQKKWMVALCANGRLARYTNVLDREIASVIGTLILAEPSSRSPHEERRRAQRLPLKFAVRYGVNGAHASTGGFAGIGRDAVEHGGSDLIDAEGCDISETGIGFIGSRRYSMGTEITVHFQLAGNLRDSWTRTRAIVRNVEGNRIGAEFSIIHPRDRAQLRQLTNPPAPVNGGGIS